MQDRLAELRRQRALIADHLAWLDRELATTIAQTGDGAPPTLEATVPQAVAKGAPDQSEKSAATVASAAEAQLPESDTGEIKDDVRRGCLLYFTVASLLVILVGALLIWASQSYKKSHPPKPRVEQQSEP